MALQTLGTESARQDARLLKTVVLNQPIPGVAVLNSGLDMLRTVDQRQQLAKPAMPVLRIYGYLDGLVPRKVATLLDEWWPQSSSVVIPKAAHAPFISHPEEFTSIINQFAASR